MITQYGAMAGLKEQNQHPLGCMAEGNERYIESAAAHAAFVSLISAVVRGRLTCTKAGGWGLARFPCAQTSAGVIWKLRHGACPNDKQPATTPIPYHTTHHRRSHRSTTTPHHHHHHHHHHRSDTLYVCLPATPPPRLVTPPSPQFAPRFHVLTSKVRQAADSLRSSTLFYQTPPTISITPLR